MYKLTKPISVNEPCNSWAQYKTIRLNFHKSLFTINILSWLENLHEKYSFSSKENKIVLWYMKIMKTALIDDHKVIKKLFFNCTQK